MVEPLSLLDAMTGSLPPPAYAADMAAAAFAPAAVADLVKGDAPRTATAPLATAAGAVEWITAIPTLIMSFRMAQRTSWSHSCPYSRPS